MGIVSILSVNPLSQNEKIKNNIKHLIDSLVYLVKNFKPEKAEKKTDEEDEEIEEDDENKFDVFFFKYF